MGCNGFNACLFPFYVVNLYESSIFSIPMLDFGGTYSGIILECLVFDSTALTFTYQIFMLVISHSVIARSRSTSTRRSRWRRSSAPTVTTTSCACSTAPPSPSPRSSSAPGSCSPSTTASACLAPSPSRAWTSSKASWPTAPQISSRTPTGRASASWSSAWALSPWRTCAQPSR